MFKENDLVRYIGDEMGGLKPRAIYICSFLDSIKNACKVKDFDYLMFNTDLFIKHEIKIGDWVKFNENECLISNVSQFEMIELFYKKDEYSEGSYIPSHKSRIEILFNKKPEKMMKRIS